MKIIPTSKDSIKPHVPQNPTANPLFSHVIKESMKNNLQSSIFLLFLQHRSTSWNDITWSLLQSKRTSRGKLAVDFLENSVLLLFHSLKSEQNFGQLFTSRRIPFFSFFLLQYYFSLLYCFWENSEVRNKYAPFIFHTKFIYLFSLYYTPLQFFLTAISFAYFTIRKIIYFII